MLTEQGVEQWARQLQGRCRGRADGRVSSHTDIASMEAPTLDISILESWSEKGVVTTEVSSVLYLSVRTV